MGRALYNLFEFLNTYDIDRCEDSTDVATGVIVVCWNEHGKVKCLGTVKYVGRTNLCKNHQDGKYGEVFVLPYYKGRTRKGTPFNRK